MFQLYLNLVGSPMLCHLIRELFSLPEPNSQIPPIYQDPEKMPPLPVFLALLPISLIFSCTFLVALLAYLRSNRKANEFPWTERDTSM